MSEHLCSLHCQQNGIFLSFLLNSSDSSIHWMFKLKFFSSLRFTHIVLSKLWGMKNVRIKSLLQNVLNAGLAYKGLSNIEFKNKCSLYLENILCIITVNSIFSFIDFIFTICEYTHAIDQSYFSQKSFIKPKIK